MEIKVNKGVSHPIEIISCGTSSCITIEEAEQAIGQLTSAVIAVKNGSPEFEAVMPSITRKTPQPGLNKTPSLMRLVFFKGMTN